MTDIRLKLRIESDGKEGRDEVVQLRGEIVEAGKSGERAGKEIQDGFNKATKSTAQTNNELRTGRRRINAVRGDSQRLNRTLTAAGASGRRSGQQINEGMTQARVAVESASDSIDKVDNSLSSLGDNQGATNAAANVGRLQSAIAAGIALIAVDRIADGIVGFASLADEIAKYESQIRLSTDSQAEFEVGLTAVRRIAADSGGAIDATAQLYARLENSTRNLSFAQGDILRATQAINRSFAISGATTNEYNNSVIQLSQGLASGTLRGDELNSVFEAAPRLVQALEDALGKTRGEIRDLAADGKISADIIINALLNQADVIDREFESLGPRLSRSTQRLKNAFEEIVADSGTVDDALTNTAESIDFLADHMDELDATLTALSLGVVTLAGRQGLVLAVSGFNNARDAVSAFVQASANGTPVVDATGKQIARTTAVTGRWARSMNVARAAGTGLFSLVGGWPTVIAAAAVGLVTLADHIQSTEERATAAARRARREAEEAARIRESQRAQARRENPDLIREDIAAAEARLQRLIPRADSGSITSGQAAEQVAFLAKELEKLNSELLAATGETAGAQGAFNQLTGEIKKQVKELAEQRLRLEQGSSGLARIAAAQINQKGLTKDQRDELAKLVEQLTEAEGALNTLKEANEEEADAQRKATRAKQDAIRDAERITQAATRAAEQLRDIDRERAAELDGPLAQAELAHQERLEELETIEQALLASGVLTLEQLQQLERARQNSQVLLDEETQSVRDRQASASDEIGLIDREIRALQTEGTVRRQLISALEIEDRIERIKQARAEQGIPLTDAEIKQLREKLGLLQDLQDAADFDFATAFSEAIEDGFRDASLDSFVASLEKAISKAWENGSSSARLALAENVSGTALDAINAFTSASNPFEGALAVAQQLPGPIGSAAGIIGNAVGIVKSIFGFGKDPRIKIGGAESGITPDDKTDTTFFTDLGEVRIELRKFKTEDLNAFVDDIRNFDNGLARILSEDRLANVTERLRTFFASEKGKDVSLEDVLKLRFEAIVDAVGGEVASLVEEFGGSLEQRIDRLADVISIDDALQDGADIFGAGQSLRDVITVLDELGVSGERLPETYNRLAEQTQFVEDAFDLLGSSVGREGEALVRWADEIATAAGGLDRARELWGSFLSDTFFAPDELLGRRIDQARQNAGTELSDVGLSADTSADDFRRLFEQQLPTLSADALVQWLEAAEAINVVNQLEKQRTDGLSDQAAAAEAAAEAERSLAEERARLAADELARIRGDLDDFNLSPIQQRLKRFDEQLAESTRIIREAEGSEADLALARARHAEQVGQIQQSLLDDINQDIEGFTITGLASDLAAFDEQLRETERAIIKAGLGEEALASARRRHALQVAEATNSLISTINEDIEQLSLSATEHQFLQLERQLIATEREIRAAGLGEEALALARRRHALQVKQLTQELTNTLLDTSDRLFGGFANAIEPLDSSAANAAASVSGLSSGLSDLSGVAERIIDAANGLLTDESVTPFNPMQRREELQRQLDLAISSGDFESVPQLAQELARAIRQTGASSAGADADILALRERLLALAPQIQDATRPVSAGAVDRIQSNTDDIASGLGRLTDTSADQVRLANEFVQQLADLASINREDAIALADRLGLPLERLPDVLGIAIASPQQETAAQIALLAEQLHVDVASLADRFGADIGTLADANGLLNDAFEAALVSLNLPADRVDEILRALAAVESATSPEEQAAAITALEMQVGELAPELANALAPFLDGLSIRDQVQVQTDLLTRMADRADQSQQSNEQLADLMRGVREDLAFGDEIAQQTSIMREIERSTVQQTIASARVAELLEDVRGNLRASNSAQGLQAFAKGGLVSGPTQALIGEAGRELVLPNPVTEFFLRHGVPVQSGAAMDIRPIVNELQSLQQAVKASGSANMQALNDRLTAVEQAIKQGSVQALNLHRETEFNQQKFDSRMNNGSKVV